MGGKLDHRRPLTDCTVRSHIVVVLTPKFDLCPGVVKVQEPMLVQAFKTNASVEAFDEGIVRGPAGSAEVQDDAVRIGPQSKTPCPADLAEACARQSTEQGIIFAKQGSRCKNGEFHWPK